MDIKKVLDDVGLALVWSKIKSLTDGKVDKENGKGLSSTDYTAGEKAKLSGIASGAQVNVLEGVQLNGASVTPTNKVVNIPRMAGASSGAPGKDGLVPAAATGDHTKFLRGDGSWQNPPDTTYGTGTVTTPGLTRLYSGTGTATDGAMTQKAISEAINAAVGGITGIDFQVVTSLPESGKRGVIYLVSKGGASGNVYTEHIWIPANNKFEQIGDTAVDLSNYYNTSNLVPLSSSEIDAITS